MTPKQTQLYWREWNAAKKAGGLTDADRYTIMEEALQSREGASAPISSKDLTNEDLDKVLAAFRAISRPASLNSQLRQQAMPKTRLLHRIAQQLQLLALFVEHPCNYAKSILQDRFNTRFLEDLSALGRTGAPPVPVGASPADPSEPPADSELAMMRNTLAARLSKLRRRGILSDHGRARAQHFGHHEAFGTVLHPLLDLTEHDINLMAGVPCRCAECSASAKLKGHAEANRNAVPEHSPGLAAAAYPGYQPQTIPNPAGVAATEDNIPF